MVYIKLSPETWTLSGLEKMIDVTSIISLNNDRYVPYNEFKNGAEKTNQPIHSLVKRADIISNIQMKRIKKIAEQTPEERRVREELKARHELRTISKTRSSKQNYYFEKVEDESIKDMSKSISFGLTFIFSFFMAGLTGYYFGIYFLSFDQVKAMVVAIIFIIITIVVETSLFIIKQNRDDLSRKKAAKNANPFNKKRQPPLKIPENIKPTTLTRETEENGKRKRE